MLESILACFISSQGKQTGNSEMDVRVWWRCGSGSRTLRTCVGAVMPDFIRSCAKEALFLKKERRRE
jgi:hypothetical protein